MNKQELNRAVERIQFRTTMGDKALLRQAADLSGFRNLSDFVRWCAINKAREVVPSPNRQLSDAESLRVAEYFLSDPTPNEELKKIISQNKNENSSNT